MDTSSVVIGVIFLVIIIAPFALMARKKQRKKNIVVKHLHSYAAQNNLKTGLVEVYDKYGYALSEDGKVFINCQVESEETNDRLYQLEQYSKCQLITKAKTLRGNNMITKIEIQLLPKDLSKAFESFVLFDLDIDIQLYGELEFAKRWEVHLNNSIQF